MPAEPAGPAWSPVTTSLFAAASIASHASPVASGSSRAIFPRSSRRPTKSVGTPAFRRSAKNASARVIISTEAAAATARVGESRIAEPAAARASTWAAAAST